jgi:hypothetical protein
VGNWLGTTSQSRPISFAVGPNGVTSVATDFEVRGGGCTVNGTINTTFTAPSPVVGGTVSFNTSSSAFDQSFRATFSSATAAAGDFTVTTKGAPCGGLSATVSWTANRS